MKKLKILNDTIDFGEEDIIIIKDVLKKSQLSIFNSELITLFEEKLLNFLYNSKKIEGGVVAMPNCTSSIFVALQMLNLKPGDEIIVPNITHSSSIYPILYMYNCKIKVCDFVEKTYNLDINHLNRLISSKTKGIIVCYLHGYPNNINDVYKVCQERNIKLIEDCAQGLGVKNGKLNAGNIGDYSCFSFGENKLLKMGEGGALKYKIEADIEKINRLRHVGEVWKETGKSTVTSNISYLSLIEKGIDYKGMGFNYRVNPLNIALGFNKLKNIENIIRIRQEKLKIYKETLKSIRGIDLINENIESTAPISAWYIVDSNLYDINEIIIKCLEYGIPVGKFKYPLIIDIEPFKEHILNKKYDFKNSNYLKNNSLFFPLYENISLEEIKKISNYLREIFLNYSKLSKNKDFLNTKIEYFDGFFMK